MKQAKTAVVFDKDSTLFNTFQRWHLSPMRDPESSWERYSQACIDDEPIPGTIRAAELHWPHHQIHICTGASATAEHVARQQLVIAGVCYDYLKMKAIGDNRPNEEYKIAYIEELRAAGVEVVLFYEDWGPAAHAIEERTGVPVVGVNPFYPEDMVKFQQSKAVDGVGGGL